MQKENSIWDRFGGKRGVILLVVGFVAATVFYRMENVGSGQAMREIGAELGLEVEKKGQRNQLRGRIDDMGVSVETTTENRSGDTRWFTDFAIYAPDQSYGRIVGANLRQKVIDSVQKTEWQPTGDAEFDKSVLVEGEVASLLAELDTETRAAVQAAVEDGWELDGYTWKARKSGRITNAQKIRSLLDSGLAAARAMDGGGETVAPIDRD